MSTLGIVRVADLRQQVYDTLKARITNGDFDVGAKFQEISLAEEMGVSRTPVREALAMLVRDGLLVQMKRGFRFPRMTAESINDITEVRLRLEPFAMHRMVKRTSQKQRESLAKLIRSEIKRHKDSDDYISAHRRMRLAILEGVGNDVLVETILQFEDSIHMMRVSTLREQKWRDKSAAGNLALADAIAAGDPEAAAEAQTELLTYACISYIDYLTDQKLPAEEE